jgi:hypothetical protein
MHRACMLGGGSVAAGCAPSDGEPCRIGLSSLASNAQGKAPLLLAAGISLLVIWAQTDICLRLLIELTLRLFEFPRRGSYSVVAPTAMYPAANSRQRIAL